MTARAIVELNSDETLYDATRKIAEAMVGTLGASRETVGNFVFEAMAMLNPNLGVLARIAAKYDVVVLIRYDGGA